MPTTQQKKEAGGLPYPVWRYWGGGTTFPQRISMESVTTGKWGRRKWLSWLRLSRGAGPIGNVPRSTLWSGAGAPPVSCPHWRRWSPEPWNVRHCQEGSHGSYSCFYSPYSRAQRGGTDCPRGTQGAMCLRARGSCAFGRRSGPHMGKNSISTTRVAHSHLNWAHTGLAWGISLGAWLDLCSLGSLWVIFSHYLAVGEVWCEFQSWVITQVCCKWPSLNPQNHLIPPKDPGTLSEQNALPTTHEQLHCSPTPWSQKVTGNALWGHSCLWLVQVNTRLLWLYEWSNVTQHHDCLVLIHPSSFLLGGLDTSSIW